MGIVHKISLDCLTKGNISEQRHLILKVPPSNPSRREQFKSRSCFEREIYIYISVLPEFTLLQKEIGCKSRFDAYANCIAAGEEMLDEFVLMEDLRSQGFSMFDRHLKLDLNHVALVMQELGKYHALNFALKDQKPDVFRKLSDIKDVFFDSVMNEGFGTYFNTLIDKAKNTLDEGDICREKLEEFRDFETLGKFLVSGEEAEPYAVITHGDCWNNNTLYRYVDGKPSEVCLLDWQIARYSSPVLDLVYYIFCCTEASLRHRHFHTFMHIYHGSLSEFLTELGSDPELLFPYQALQDQLKKFGKFGLMMSLMVIQAMVMQPEETPDLDEVARLMEEDPHNIKFMDPGVASEMIYNRRMRDIIHDMNDLGYI